MLHILTDPLAEDVEGDLANDEEEDAKCNITQRPPVLERVDDEDDLHDDVDKQLDPVDEVQDDEQTRRVHRAQASPALECQQTDGEGNHKHAERGQPQEPDRQGGAILIKLKADKAVDEQARTQRARDSILNRGEVWEDVVRARRNHAGIQHQTQDRQQHVDVEEGGDFLAADGGEFGADVQHHDDGHGQRDDVHDVGRALEDDGVGQFDRERVAGRHDAGGGGRGEFDGAGADEGTEGDGALGAYFAEVAEGHGDGGGYDDDDDDDDGR